MKRRQTLLWAGAAAVTAGLTPAARAQAYPSSLIRMVVPFPPGGGFDALGRAFADQLALSIGQRVLVDNKPGASANIGADNVARSPADGYTLLFTNEILIVNAATFKKLPFDPFNDFSPISTVATTPLAMAANNSLPAQNLQDMLQLARTRSLSFGTPGQGSVPHLMGELLAQQTGARLNHIPYKGSAQLINDVIGGHVDLAFTTLVSLAPSIKSGSVRGLASFSETRSAAVPGLPTAKELGVPIEPHESWYALYAPANLPPAVLRRLVEAAQDALRQPAYLARAANLGYDARSSTPQELAAMGRRDLDKWNRVVAKANIPKE